MRRIIAGAILAATLAGIGSSAAQAASHVFAARDQHSGLSCSEAKWAVNVYFGYTVNTATCLNTRSSNEKQLNTPNHVYIIDKTSKFLTGLWYIEPIKRYD